MQHQHQGADTRMQRISTPGTIGLIVWRMRSQFPQNCNNQTIQLYSAHGYKTTTWWFCIYEWHSTQSTKCLFNNQSKWPFVHLWLCGVVPHFGCHCNQHIHRFWPFTHFSEEPFWLLCMYTSTKNPGQSQTSANDILVHLPSSLLVDSFFLEPPTHLVIHGDVISGDVIS